MIFLSNANPYQAVILILYLSQIKVSPHLPSRLIPNVRMFQISINPIYLHTNWIKCNINVEKYFCWAKYYIHHNFLFLDWSKKHVDIQTWLNASPKNLLSKQNVKFGLTPWKTRNFIIFANLNSLIVDGNKVQANS